MFKKDPNYFYVYHQGFDTQVGSWPVNPLTIVEKEVRGLVQNEKMTVVDLGCGKGDLELRLRDLPTAKVFSYDLISSNDHVIECDISNLPIKKRKVDIAIFCLSLMGTNHVDMIKEAHRVLKKQGFLIVAEVSTRFQLPVFVSNMHKLGFLKKKVISPNSFFTVFIFRKINPSNEVVLQLLEPCRYKKR